MIAISLRTRVFLLIAAIVVLVTAILMTVSLRSVTTTVYDSEERAAANTLRLVSLDIESRYRHLLREKIASVRSYRSQLESQGAMIEATLRTFMAVSAARNEGPAAAQRNALDWLAALPATHGMQVMVYDTSLKILSHPQPFLIGSSLAQLRDIKGQDLANAAYAQPSQFGVYQWPDAVSGDMDTHFGYFRRFDDWDWVVVVSSHAGDIQREVERKRNDIVLSVADTLSRLTLARSGFVFVLSGDGNVVIPPPAGASHLLDASDTASGRPLRDLLTGIARRPDITETSFTPDDGEAWELGAAYIKPLDWYVASLVPRSNLTEPADRLLRQQAVVFLVMLGVGLLLAWLFASRLIRPLNLLSRYARQLPERDLTTAHRVPPDVAALPLRHRDEVGRLASSFLQMEERLQGNVLRLMDETSARERIESELSIARDIQLGLLPISLDASVLRKVDLFATMTAAKEVGGDLYDYFMMADGRLCLAIGDVSGKGVPAALFMAITRTLLRSAANQESSAGRLMEVVNDRLAEHNPNMMFVTLFVGILDLRTGELEYANAGHPAPWLLSQGRISLLAGRSGPACGVAEGIPYAAFTTTLMPDTALIGYTDGVTEADDPTGAFYGDERGASVLEALPAGSSSRQLADALQEDVLAFARDAEQADDITLIVVRRLDGAEDPS